ncbi:MAG: hypothetical protein COA70_11555 [Planctomycetota bacterium]|nr:MAG: hypothetical protein COA70_11555 [Planctomycetota bacterium]
MSESSFTEPTRFELSRIRGFIKLQVIFLFASPLAGGGHFKLWSMLDTAILVLSIGLTALAFVLESKAGRTRIMNFAVGLYLAAVVDMALNISIAGVLGWKYMAKVFMNFD